jgi:hypothetical protein
MEAPGYVGSARSNLTTPVITMTRQAAVVAVFRPSQEEPEKPLISNSQKTGTRIPKQRTQVTQAEQTEIR